jgi:GDP-D-mannose dehydratase
MKRALITVITGQDGSFLAELLLEKGYQVIGYACFIKFFSSACCVNWLVEAERVGDQKAEFCWFLSKSLVTGKKTLLNSNIN